MSFYYISHGVHRLLLSRLSYSANVPTYFYRFDFDSATFNHYRILKCGPKQRGVAHADEISYLFNNIMTTKLSPDSREFKTIQRMIELWTTFATNSNPNCSILDPTVWEPVESTNSIKCLNINDELKLINVPEQKKFELFDSFYVENKLF